MSKERDISALRVEVNDVFSQLQASFSSGKTRSYDWRIAQLLQLKRMVMDHEQVFVDALAADLGRPKFEAVVADIDIIYTEVDMHVSNLSSWMKPTSTDVVGLVAPARSDVVCEPYGVCLILGAFNYPLNLLLVPMIGAISAGNAAVLKPSEISSATEQAVFELLPRYMDMSCFACICGGIITTTALLEISWDKIFFTGSTRVGKIVMAAAAKNLTPISLELGGKSPTYIDETVTDLKMICQRIISGKMMNAGQTCVAPDYILCHMKHYEAFLEQCSDTIEAFYGPDPFKSESYSRLVTVGHCERLKTMLMDDNDSGRRRLVCGGQVDPSQKYMAPTVVADVSPNDCLMQDEIFGPILPVIPVSSTDEAVEIMKQHPKPLALYVFSKSEETIENVLARVQSGAAVVNDVVMHTASSMTPFGGVGPSGLGAYRGKFSFDAFSHHRTVLRRDDHAIFDAPFRYPPYSEKNLSVVRAVAKLPPLPSMNRVCSFAARSIIFAGIVATGFYLGHKFGDKVAPWF